MKEFVRIEDHLIAVDKIDYISLDESEVSNHPIICYNIDGSYIAIHSVEDFYKENVAVKLKEKRNFVEAYDLTTGDRYLINLDSVIDISKVDEHNIKITFDKHHLYLFYKTEETFKLAFQSFIEVCEV